MVLQRIAGANARRAEPGQLLLAGVGDAGRGGEDRLRATNVGEREVGFGAQDEPVELPVRSVLHADHDTARVGGDGGRNAPGRVMAIGRERDRLAAPAIAEVAADKEPAPIVSQHRSWSRQWRRRRQCHVGRAGGTRDGASNQARTDAPCPGDFHDWSPQRRTDLTARARRLVLRWSNRSKESYWNTVKFCRAACTTSPFPSPRRIGRRGRSRAGHCNALSGSGPGLPASALRSQRLRTAASSACFWLERALAYSVL